MYFSVSKKIESFAKVFPAHVANVSIVSFIDKLFFLNVHTLVPLQQVLAMEGNAAGLAEEFPVFVVLV